MPGQPDAVPLAAAIASGDLAVCRGFIKHHSKSFYLSSLLLPRGCRHEAWAVYAFCRKADDSVDGENPGDGTVPAGAPTEAAALRRIHGLRKRLAAVYAGQPGDGPGCAIDRAFAAVVRRTGLPQKVPQRLLTGMQMDAQDTRYATWDELTGYCFNVAATVGLMMTYLLGHRMPAERRTEVLLRACDLGIAMQLTNIARDIGEDGCRGRVYLPDELLYRHGLHREALLTIIGTGARVSPLPLRRAVSELLERAASHYAAARAGIPMLPRAAWLGIASAERIYRAIGEALARAGCDPLVRRARVSTAGKLWRVLGAFVSGLLPAARHPPPRLTAGPADPLLARLCAEVEVIAPQALLPPKS